MNPRQFVPELDDSTSIYFTLNVLVNWLCMIARRPHVLARPGTRPLAVTETNSESVSDPRYYEICELPVWVAGKPRLPLSDNQWLLHDAHFLWKPRLFKRPTAIQFEKVI